MANISLRYSTGSLSTSSTGIYLDESTIKPFRGLGAFGGKMATSGLLLFSSRDSYEITPDIVGNNYIWDDISRQENINEYIEYRCLYIRVSSGYLFDPIIYLQSVNIAEYEIKVADYKNTECGIVIPNSYTEPADPNATGPWIVDPDLENKIQLMPANSMLSNGDYIYFWIKRKANKNIAMAM
jgi:hypothetical protein